jgi:hypothetical protein
LQSLNPHLEVKALVGDLETLPWGLFRSDIMVAGLDSLGARVALNQVAGRLGIPWLDGGVDPRRWLGRVNGYWPGHSRPCLECGLSEADYRSGLQQRHACQPVTIHEPTQGSFELGALVASWLALECSRWLAGQGGEGLFDRQLLADVRHYRQFITRIQFNPTCRFDHRNWDVEGVKDITPQSSLGDLLTVTRSMAGFSSPGILSLENHSFTTRLHCRHCTRDKSCFHLSERLTPGQRACPSCGTSTMSSSGSDLMDHIGEGTSADLLEYSLEQVGVQRGDIITRQEGEKSRHFEICQESLDRSPTLKSNPENPLKS